MKLLKNSSGRAVFGTCILAGVLTASGGTALLQLQRAPAAAGPWQELPADPTALTPEGSLADTTGSTAAFYRLNITVSNVTGGALAIPLASAPKQAVQFAQAKLAENLGGLWPGGAMLSYAYPVYDPSINGGTAPAYFEFKVVPAPNTVGTNPFPNAPTEPTSDLGYILVAATTDDVPVPEFAPGGLPRVEQLRRLAGNSKIKAMRYGHGFWVAEDSTGNPAATIGSMPYKPSQALTKLGPNSFFGQGTIYPQDNGSNVVQDPGPYPGADYGAYKGYSDFKADYAADNSVLGFLRARRAEAGLFRWNLEAGILPPRITVPIGEPTQVLLNAQVTGVDLEDPVAEVTLNPGSPGVRVYGKTGGETTLHVFLSNGTTAYYLLQIGTGSAVMPKGWTPWQYWWAGGCGEQRRYTQVWGGSCWSGCGATAWAMFYGWYDLRGLCNLVGPCSSPTPNSNDGNVNSCIWYEVPWLSTFCAYSQGATLPSEMWKGYHWSSSRGYAISWNIHWGVPYVLSSAGRNDCISAIQSGRPAIVGIGFYSHYPLAWGYAHSEYHDPVFGWTLWHDRRFFVNEGWGGDPCAGCWVSADDTFYGSNVTCW
jgi:hypothetical protein